ncbi:MAG TPA: hypothetical protein QGF58_08245, partial [Myxococcota bacterium]|nr:hypothetical protein [Myxococcota bacterium]
GTWQQREAALLRIDEVGRRQWRKESGAHQQARAENGMYRFKQILGPDSAHGPKKGRGGKR